MYRWKQIGGKTNSPFSIAFSLSAQPEVDTQVAKSRELSLRRYPAVVLRVAYTERADARAVIGAGSVDTFAIFWIARHRGAWWERVRS